MICNGKVVDHPIAGDNPAYGTNGDGNEIAGDGGELAIAEIPPALAQPLIQSFGVHMILPDGFQPDQVVRAGDRDRMHAVTRENWFPAHSSGGLRRSFPDRDRSQHIMAQQQIQQTVCQFRGYGRPTDPSFTYRAVSQQVTPQEGPLELGRHVEHEVRQPLRVGPGAVEAKHKTKDRRHHAVHEPQLASPRRRGRIVGRLTTKCLHERLAQLGDEPLVASADGQSHPTALSHGAFCREETQQKEQRTPSQADGERCFDRHSAPSQGERHSSARSLLRSCWRIAATA